MTWRLFHNSLPVFINLERRGLTVFNYCGFCGYSGKDANHLFFHCWWSKYLWKSLGLEDRVWQNSVNWNITDRIWYILTEEDQSKLGTILMTLWVIWYKRNLVVHCKKEISIEACCLKVTNSLHQFASRNIMGLSSQHWHDPDPNCDFTFFSDGSWSKTDRNGGWATVVMVDKFIIRCKAGYSNFSASTLEEELKGMLAALMLFGVCIKVSGVHPTVQL